MSKGLRIYACSGIGEAQQQAAQTPFYDYWTDNTNTAFNTQAVNGLLSKINLNISEVENLELSDEQITDRLNNIDFLVVCLEAAKNYAQHYSKLETSGAVIYKMLYSGSFDNNSLDGEERDRNLDDLIASFNNQMATGEKMNISDSEFEQWWNENIVTRNQFGFNAEMREAIQASLVANIQELNGISGWQDDKDISKMLNNAGEYFLYTYFTDAQLKKLPAVFTEKKQQQMQTYDWCKGIFVGLYGSEQDMRNIIRAGITAYFKHTPEQVCKKIASGENVKPAGVGIVWTAGLIIKLITVIVSAIVSIITVVLKVVKDIKVAKYQAINIESATSATPNSDDFEDLDFSTLGGSKTLYWIIGALGLVWLLKK